MKKFFWAFFIVYYCFFIGDYLTACHHFTKPECQKWMEKPIWVHFAFPGIGNYCLDFGLKLMGPAEQNRSPNSHRAVANTGPIFHKEKK